MSDKLAAIGHLRMALKEMVEAHPCPFAGACHCPTCVAQHALSATGGFKEAQDEQV